MAVNMAVTVLSPPTLLSADTCRPPSGGHQLALAKVGTPYKLSVHHSMHCSIFKTLCSQQYALFLCIKAFGACASVLLHA